METHKVVVEEAIRKAWRAMQAERKKKSPKALLYQAALITLIEVRRAAREMDALFYDKT